MTRFSNVPEKSSEQDQSVWLCSLETPLFCFFDLICLTEIEILYFWPKSEDKVREFLLPCKKSSKI